LLKIRNSFTRSSEADPSVWSAVHRFRVGLPFQGYNDKVARFALTILDEDCGQRPTTGDNA
jgi:hypothetical protein